MKYVPSYISTITLKVNQETKGSCILYLYKKNLFVHMRYRYASEKYLVLKWYSVVQQITSKTVIQIEAVLCID